MEGTETTYRFTNPLTADRERETPPPKLWNLLLLTRYSPAEYPLSLHCIYMSERLSLVALKLRMHLLLSIPLFYLLYPHPTPPTHFSPCLTIRFLIHHCLLCNNISLSQTLFPSFEIDSGDDTKQFISPFIPCFLLIAPPAPLCVSGSEWEEALERLIGYSANYPAFCGCPMMTGLMLGCREILERIM